MYVIGMNGPPRSGKDSVANGLGAIIEDRHGIQPQLIALSSGLRRTIYAMMGVEYSLSHFEANKDRPIAALGGKTIRQAMIHLMETYLRPTYGNDFLCQAGMNRVWSDAKVIIITDYGFQVEPDFFQEAFGKENHFLARIHREGFDYKNDSRSYLVSHHARDFPIAEGLDQVAVEANRIYEHLLITLGWQF